MAIPSTEAPSSINSIENVLHPCFHTLRQALPTNLSMQAASQFPPYHCDGVARPRFGRWSAVADTEMDTCENVNLFSPFSSFPFSSNTDIAIIKILDMIS